MSSEEKITMCRLCGTPLPEVPALHLHNVPRRVQYFPSADQLQDDSGAELEVYQCVGCGLVQLNSMPVIYSEHGQTSTSAYSQGMMAYRRQQMAAFIDSYNLKGKKVVDVGCGDGFLLEILSELDIDAVGIDAAEEAIEKARNRGLNAHVGYFNRDAKVEGYPFDAFVSTDVLEHVPDLTNFLQGIAANLREGAIGLIETHNVDNLIEKHRFYDFVLDHLSYFTVDTFRLSLELSGFEVMQMEVNREGENLTAWVKKRPTNQLRGLSTHMAELGHAFNAFVQGFAAQGRRVAIWGASFQMLTLASLVDMQDIAYVVDSAPYKQGKYTTVSHLPIVSPDTLKTDPVDAILVIAARYNAEIIEQIQTKEQFQGTVASLNGVNIEIVKEAAF